MAERPVTDPAHRQAVGLLLLTALGWSLGGVLMKSVDWPPFAVGGGRGLVAAVFLLAVRGRTLRFTWTPLQLGTALAFTGCTILFAAATKLTTAANAVLLQTPRRSGSRCSAPGCSANAPAAPIGGLSRSPLSAWACSSTTG